jgi:hypothetical protein
VVRLASDVSTTRRPRDRVQNSSSTEMSKESEVTASHVSPGAWGMRSSIAAKKAATCACSTITPLGLPVEPEV